LGVEASPMPGTLRVVLSLLPVVMSTRARCLRGGVPVLSWRDLPRYPCPLLSPDMSEAEWAVSGRLMARGVGGLALRRTDE
jgi:hypothetical protein